MKKDQEKSPWLNVPLHTLIKLTPQAYGTKEEIFKANIEAVSTWRGKGSIAKHEDPVEGQDGLGVSAKEVADKGEEEKQEGAETPKAENPGKPVDEKAV